jgi:MOSC domain-containing protein YiiM
MSLLPLLVDPSAYDEPDLFNTFRMLTYFLDVAVDGDLGVAPESVRAQINAFHALATSTLTVFADDISPAKMNQILWQRYGAKDGANLSRGALYECVRECIEAARQAGRNTRADATGEGVVHGLFRSDGGVPKLPVDRIEIGARGIVGDRQKHRKHHGRPFQAVCLWTQETIAALQAEGHPIQPGSAGENITVRGLPWDVLRPGLQLQVGEVTLEVSAYADPCSFNAKWFADHKFSRIDHDRHPGWSRTYAWVLTPGTVTIDDPVVVEPSRRSS